MSDAFSTSSTSIVPFALADKPPARHPSPEPDRACGGRPRGTAPPPASRRPSIDTVAVRGGVGTTVRVDPATGGACGVPSGGTSTALVPDICQSTTFAQQRVGGSVPHTYSRASNPTVATLEQALGTLEDAPPAVCFRSGLAAITALLLAYLKQGDEVLLGTVVYGGTVRLLREVLADLGVRARVVDTRDVEGVRAALGPATKLVFLETPANPTLILSDVAAIAAACREAGVALAVDNTFLTPILLRPLDLGATAAVYSTTKYHDGHNSTVGGAVVSRDEALLERLRRIRKSVGSIQAPQEAWLTLRGLKTLPLRLRRQSASALRIAQWLEGQPWIERVLYPGLPSFPQAELAQRTLSAHGGIVAFECRGGAEVATALLEETRLCTLAENLGATETLLTHPTTMTHGDVPRAQREAAGITEGLIRLSVGLEDPEDIVDDLQNAWHRAVERQRAARSTVVLKFGSSVLRSEADLPAAVHEIYRHVRRGQRVVAVVSAIGDATDGLLAQAEAVGADRSGDPADRAVASLLATGEIAATALLALAVRRAGLPCEALEPHTLDLRTSGPTLEASPTALDDGALRAALARVPVVVVPGFAGRDERDLHTTLLGRGGSDLTAAFIAQRLDAGSTILLKDVDGVHTADPNAATQDRAPGRYRCIRWEEAIHVAGPLVQARAVEHAATHGRSIEVRRLLACGDGAGCGTIIGGEPSRLADPALDVRPLRVVVLGAGVVGGGVIQRLLALPSSFELRGVLTRDPLRARRAGVPEHLLLADIASALASGAEVLVELVGGLHPATAWVEEALTAGLDVVTANKAMLASAQERLAAAARRSGAALLHSAAVGGAAPVLETIDRLRGSGLVRIDAALSGTCNLVLDRLGRGGSLASALAEARRAGLVEADPTLDLSGRDLLHKLQIIARRAGAALDEGQGRIEGLETIDPSTVHERRRQGLDTRLLGSLDLAPFGRSVGRSAGRPVDRALSRQVRSGEAGSDRRVEFSQPTFTVAPVALAADHPLAGLRGCEVGAVLTTADGRRTVLRGAGAGRWPTTEAVLADLLDLHSGAVGRRATRRAEGRP